MASPLSIDLASSLLSQSLAWPRCTLKKLKRAASLRCQSSRPTPHTQETPLPRCHSASRHDEARSYGSNDANGWGMVLVLNQLLDVTASQQHQRRLSSHNLDQADTEELRRTATRARCTNCQRRFSLVHDAASLPQGGFCSADCRASHEYMNAIDADLDGAFKKPSLCCSTLDSSYSPVEPASHFDSLVPSHARP